MLTKVMIHSLNQRFNVEEERIETILQDYNDDYIKRALKKCEPQRFEDLRNFLLVYAKTQDERAHLLGFDNAEHMETCYKQFEKVQQELREGIK